MQEDTIIGIDLGTTNSAVGVMDTGFPVLIPDAQGRRLTPSVVDFNHREPLVGAAVANSDENHASSVVYSAKRLMGRRYQELTADEMGDLAYGIVEAADGWAGIRIGDRIRMPEEVSCEVLRKLKADAEAYLDQEVMRAVISVPAYFNDVQRQKTKQAAEHAGLTVERMISEPTAAALAYGVDREYPQAKIAVYDLGGGTFDISILELNEGVFEVLSTHGNTQLGGDDIDQALVDWIKNEIAPKAGNDTLSKASEVEGRLRRVAERTKLALSSRDSVSVDLPEYNWSRTLDRAWLNRLARPVIERTRKSCLRALQDSGLRLDELNTVLLVGGQTRMPLVREVVRDIFGQTPDTSVDPDEAVARGATVQSGILSGKLQELVLLDVTPLSLGIETFGGLMNVIIPRNSTIPCKAGEVFTTAVDFQETMRVSILQGERELAADNWKLGEMTIDFQKAARGEARVGVQFEIDSNGMLQVLARDITTGKEQQVEVDSAVDVSDEDVEKMVSESVDHAFEDMEARRKIEAWTKAKRLIETTRKAMSMAGDALSDNIKREIEVALASLAEMESRGSSREIKAQIQVLDQASLPLADLLMEQAMEQAVLKALES
ncbi:MAG: Hsp70 family protein [Verrucomicrobiota bacterium]